MWSEAIRTIGGLVAVVVGLLVLLAITVTATVLVKGSDAQVATIASSAFGVIGTIVGAYFGVKVGTDQTARAMGQVDDAIQRLVQEASKAQVFAAHLVNPTAETTSPGSIVDQAMGIAAEAAAPPGADPPPPERT